MEETEERLLKFLDVEYARVVAAVTLVTSAPAAAEDAVQEALVRAWERLDSGDSIDSLEAWVSVVAFRLGASWIRRRRAERRAVDRLSSFMGSDTSFQDPSSADVAHALQQLPRRQREVAILHYWLEFDLGEISRHLGVSAGTAKKALDRGRHRMAVILGEHYLKGESVADNG